MSFIKSPFRWLGRMHRCDCSAHVRMTRRSGDVDLLLELPMPVEQPALLAATLSAKVSRALHGSKVDVLIHAPNLLHQAIHDHAPAEAFGAACATGPTWLECLSDFPL